MLCSLGLIDVIMHTWLRNGLRGAVCVFGAAQ